MRHCRYNIMIFLRQNALLLIRPYVLLRNHICIPWFMILVFHFHFHFQSVSLFVRNYEVDYVIFALQEMSSKVDSNSISSS